MDEWTGYRYYTICQMQKLNIIRQLQRLGFSLDEIKELYEEDSHVPSVEQLTEKINKTEELLKQLMERREQLKEWLESSKKHNDMETYSIESLPEVIVASHREVIPDYSALGMLCYEKIGPEMQRLGCKCPMPGYCFTIEHSAEFSLESIDIEYCEQVVEMGENSHIIQFKCLPAVEKALCVMHHGPYERFYETFAKVFQYIEENGYRIIDHPRTCYIDGIWNQEDPEKWLSIIQVPIE